MTPSLFRRGALEVSMWLKDQIDYLNARWDCWQNNKHQEVTYEVAYGYGICKCLICGKRLRMVATRK